MAVATKTTAGQMLAHAQSPYVFTFTPFLQATYQHGLPADRPICKAYASGHCSLGTRCPERHTSSSGSGGGREGGSSFNSLVCKHWLRGLCKKGESCEFLHEYNLRKMPECNFFVRNGYCSNGDECLYLHIDPLSKLPPCPHYDRGFCALGARCAKRHVRRALCPFYLAGFCPGGRGCKEGAHPRWEKNLEKATVRVEGGEDKKEDGVGAKREHDDEDEREMGRDRDRGGDRDRDRDRSEGRHDRQGSHKDKFGGGRGGRWRGRGGGTGGGGHKFRGRH